MRPSCGGWRFAQRSIRKTAPRGHAGIVLNAADHGAAQGRVLPGGESQHSDSSRPGPGRSPGRRQGGEGREVGDLCSGTVRGWFFEARKSFCQKRQANRVSKRNGQRRPVGHGNSWRFARVFCQKQAHLGLRAGKHAADPLMRAGVREGAGPRFFLKNHSSDRPTPLHSC